MKQLDLDTLSTEDMQRLAYEVLNQAALDLTSPAERATYEEKKESYDLFFSNSEWNTQDREFWFDAAGECARTHCAALKKALLSGDAYRITRRGA